MTEEMEMIINALKRIDKLEEKVGISRIKSNDAEIESLLRKCKSYMLWSLEGIDDGWVDGSHTSSKERDLLDELIEWVG